MYTGNTCAVALTAVTHAVYPCVYREHIHTEHVFYKQHGLSLCIHREHELLEQAQAIYTGLSLCIQGTHLVPVFIMMMTRFIPVYTGNTEFRIQKTS